MGDMNENPKAAGDSSTAGDRKLDRPTSRTKYVPDPAVDINNKLVALYKVDQEVYLKGTRGVDPISYKIYKVLGDGQYELSRGGKVQLKKDGKNPEIYLEENLQTQP